MVCPRQSGTNDGDARPEGSDRGRVTKNLEASVDRP